MRYNKFNEDTRVKIPATIHFLRLGYEYKSLVDSKIDFNTKIFIDIFKESIEKINGRRFVDKEIISLLNDINNMLKNNDLGKEFHDWLIYPNGRVKLIDFENIDNNNFSVVDELPFAVEKDTEVGSFRPDITILVNGIPLSIMEVKKPNNDGGIQMEFQRILDKRLKNSSYNRYFNMFHLMSFSNNMEYEKSDEVDFQNVKAGSFYSIPNSNDTVFSFFREDVRGYHLSYDYKTVSDKKMRYILKDCGYDDSNLDTEEFKENLSQYSPCNKFITSIYDKNRFLYLLNYGVVYIDGIIPQRHIMRYPQFFATKNILDTLDKGLKGGIIWHTQGSGKTALAAYSNRIISDYYSKKGINTRFFFVVDRLDLARQAASEFRNRGLNVIECHSKREFTNELNKVISTSTNTKNNGEIVVVNIQKFDENIPQAENKYNVDVKRIFFVDEAHRSYSTTGQFYADLMGCDDNGVFIALTGTPILTKKERSNLKFGDYIHKYFYNSSIEDGYTLKIKKEYINTVATSEIRENLKIDDKEFDSKDIYESEKFISSICDFLLTDFRHFRLENGDNTLGGMVVCRSNAQAKKIHEWIEKNYDKYKLKSGLVMTDTENPEQKEINKNNQLNFRDSLSPDILVVHYMLTTGYDVKRLKKMYLLREPKSQSLLQTITRVNRPYTSPNGKVYKYGYIVDFVDINEEYKSTINNYIKELEEEFKFMDDEDKTDISLSSIIDDKDTIYKRYQSYKSDLLEEVSNIENKEYFRKLIDSFEKSKILKIKRLLSEIKECYTEFRLSNAYDYAKEIDLDNINSLLKIVNDRLKFINLHNNPLDMLYILENDEILDVVYEFIKTKVIILNLSEMLKSISPKMVDFSEKISTVQIKLKENKNKDDIRLENLSVLLKEIFEKLSFLQSIDDIVFDDLTKTLDMILKEIDEINKENEKLAQIYDGQFAYVKSYQDIKNYYKYYENYSMELERLFSIIFEANKDITRNVLLIQGKDGFIQAIKKSCTSQCLREKSNDGISLYKKLVLRDNFDYILKNLYDNLLMY